MFIHIFSALWHAMPSQLFWRFTICIDSFPLREYYSNAANRKGTKQQHSDQEDRKACTKVLPSEYSTGQRVSTITYHWTFQMTMTKVCVRMVMLGFLKILCGEPIFLPKSQLAFSYQLLKEESNTAGKCYRRMM